MSKRNKLSKREMNAEVIRTELKALFKKAHKAGVQIEVQKFKDNHPHEVFEVVYGDLTDPMPDGEYLCACVDPDRKRKIRL